MVYLNIFAFSFGTDSPLDMDIKGRLMQQVLPALSAQYDDEQAYISHHKQEAEKRLNGERQGRLREIEREQERKQKEEQDRWVIDSTMSEV
jgi:hypothetical protein